MVGCLTCICRKTTLKNCIDEPLLLGSHDLSTKVLNVVPPPFLHFILGNEWRSEFEKLLLNLTICLQWCTSSRRAIKGIPLKAISAIESWRSWICFRACCLLISYLIWTTCLEKWLWGFQCFWTYCDTQRVMICNLAVTELPGELLVYSNLETYSLKEGSIE